MLKEKGLVIDLKLGEAWVQTLSHTSCSSCQVSSTCGTGLVNKAFGERSFITPISNSVEAQLGDEVEVGIPENLVVKASFLVYMLPLVSMFIGISLLYFWNNNLAEWITILGAFLGLGVGFYAIREIEKRVRKNNQLKPVLLRITKQAIVNKTIPVKHIETT